MMRKALLTEGLRIIQVQKGEEATVLLKLLWFQKKWLQEIAFMGSILYKKKTIFTEFK